jgi:hypothetical protein
MSVLRRHLGAFGLLVVLSQFAMQAAAQAALCCRPVANTATAAAECCPAGSHPGKVCPVHAAKRAAAPTDATCRMVCTRDADRSLLQSIAGGPLPAGAELSLTEPVALHAAAVDRRPPSPPSDPVSPPPRHPSL